MPGRRTIFEKPEKSAHCQVVQANTAGRKRTRRLTSYDVTKHAGSSTMWTPHLQHGQAVMVWLQPVQTRAQADATSGPSAALLLVQQNFRAMQSAQHEGGIVSGGLPVYVFLARRSERQTREPASQLALN
jgi:hypothetical protein